MKIALLLFFLGLFLSQLLFAGEQINVEKIYHKQCATCHGDAGDGHGRAGASLIPTPTDFTVKKIAKNKIMEAIRNGVQGSSMVAYANRFNEETLERLAEYIQTQFMGMQINPPANANQIPGNEIYVKNCSACHGDNGNTAVWAKNSLNPPPRNFTDPKAKEELSRERMILSVTYGRPGTAMASFAGQLSDADLAAVVTYERNSWGNNTGDMVQPSEVKAAR